MHAVVNVYQTPKCWLLELLEELHSGLQLLQHKKAGLCHWCEWKIILEHAAKALITVLIEVHICIFQENMIQLSQKRSNVIHVQYLQDIT